MGRLVLSAAGLYLDVVGPEPLLEPLRRECGGGDPDGALPWAVSVVLDDSLPCVESPLYGVQPRCSGGECLLVSEGYAGWVDSRARRASLSLHRCADAGDVQYFLRVAAALQIFVQGGILFHAAGVEWGEGNGLAFFGRSGSGKTTVSAFAADAGLTVLHDDLLILRPGDDEWRMWGAPFGGWSQFDGGVPLVGLLFLVQDSVDEVVPLRRAQLLGELVGNSPVISGDDAWLPTLFGRWERLTDRVASRALRFRLGDGFVGVVSDWVESLSGPRRIRRADKEE